MKINSEKEEFWATTYAKNYIEKNSKCDHTLGAMGWREILKGTKLSGINSYFECGSNIGRNLTQLKLVYPDAKPHIIEICKSAFDYASSRHDLAGGFNGSILDSNFDENSFDLVFTMGVLIHINPEQLLDCMERMHRYSQRFIVIGEYFNREPVSIEYQGEKERLYKRDFGKLFVQNFDVKLLDYGFLWGHIFEAAGFDDITWWLFEKHRG